MILLKNVFRNYLTFVSLLFLVMTSCTSSDENSPVDVAPVEGNIEISEKQFQSSHMKLGKWEKKEFYSVIRVNGRIDVPPKNKASISSYFGGSVMDILVLTGEEVKKGQTLIILENPEYIQVQQDYLEAKGQLSYLKSDYERQKALFENKATSQKNYLKAESEYTITRVRLESLAKKLKLMNIDPSTLSVENMQTTINLTSPVQGFVTEVHVTKGSFLNPSELTVSVVNTDHLHLELNVFERDLSKVRIGQSIAFRIQDNTDKEYQATVYLVNKNIDPKTRTVALHGHLVDEKLSLELNPGMYAEASIYSRPELEYSIPKNALVESEGNYYVLIMTNSIEGNYTFIKKKIDIGKTNGGYVQILNTQEFNEQTDFLVDGAFNLISE